jgi:curved DNA-binding protein
LVKFKDYYETLGIPRTATDKEIKAAYRKLARQHHPDANKGNKASEEKFKEITEAYEVLKDPDKRRRYDMLGANYKDGADFRPPPDFGAGGFTFDFGDLGDLGRGSPFSDFFEMLFGQGFAQGAAGAGVRHAASSTGRARKAFDQEAEIELTIEELARGATRTLQISAPGAKGRTLEVKIPAGVRAGSKVRVPGEGGKIVQGEGDLYLRVKVKPHHHFSIDGDNLISEIEISPAIAVVGGETPVDTIEGPVRIRIPASTQNGRMLRLRGKGLPRVKTGQKGDQLVRIKIVIPTTVSDEEKELYEQLAKLERKKLDAKQH